MKNSTYKYARIALVLLALGFPVCCPALPAALDPIETLKSMEVTEKEPEASISTASTVVSLIRAEIKFPEAKIGFIGPLSGDNAEYGEKVRNGIALAISKFNAEHNSSVEFVACDSKDDSETAIKFLRSFSTDPKAVAVVGPVTGASLEEIIKTCNMLELPVITPTVFFSGELPGNRFFFRNNLSPADEGSSIAGYALNTLKLKKFAVLRTNSLYSRLCFEAFKTAVAAGGGEVLKEGTAEEGQYDLKPLMLSLGGIDPHIIKEIVESDKQNLESVAAKLVSHIKFLCAPKKGSAKVIILNLRNPGKNEKKLHEDLNFGSQLAKKASYSLAKLKEIEMIEMSRVYRFLAGARLKEEDGLEAVCQKFEADFMVTGSVLETSPGSFEAEASVYGAASGTATKVSFSFTVTNMPEGNILGLEAVYLPVEPPDAENIISHLAFFDLKMTLLGNSKWYNKTFLAGPAKPNLENAVFTAPFFASGSDPLTASFTEEYRAKYYEDPDELASSGFDTVGLVLKALENGAAGKRETEAALNTLDGVPGLNGSYTSLNREFKRKPRLLSVKEGELTEIK